MPVKEKAKRAKLQTFADFAGTLLPHETAWLLRVQRFTDAEKKAILERLHHNCLHFQHPLPFEPEFDKRKYSFVKQWASEKLHEADADVQFEWMNELERKITTDTIAPEEEKKLLQTLRRARPTDYFFLKFYELVQMFRHFLLIRLRHKEHQEADFFLKKHRAAWERAKRTYEQLHEATLDIVNQHSTGAGESEQWQQWLQEVLYDETLDGQNRYFALIRLIFVHLNYGRVSVLLATFDYQDKIFSEGTYYAKRLLLNYYGQRLLLHSKLKDYEKAEFYGYLSLRGHNSDYLFYANNLAAILLRTQKYKEALDLMKSLRDEAKNTRNFYNRIGFVAFYMRSLICNGQHKSAENYGAAFLNAYAKEILEYRWHLFFTNYLGALFHLGKHARLLTVARQYKLLQRDKEYANTASYLPFIPWYCVLAEYLETGKGLRNLATEIKEWIRAQGQESDRLPLVRTFLEEAKTRVPDLWPLLGSMQPS